MGCWALPLRADGECVMLSAFFFVSHFWCQFRGMSMHSVALGEKEGTASLK